eukprot:SAG31_NODE_10357_length_1149_cov_0.940000_1_plen_226_part_00
MAGLWVAPWTQYGGTLELVLIEYVGDLWRIGGSDFSYSGIRATKMVGSRIVAAGEPTFEVKLHRMFPNGKHKVAHGRAQFPDDRVAPCVMRAETGDSFSVVYGSPGHGEFHFSYRRYDPEGDGILGCDPSGEPVSNQFLHEGRPRTEKAREAAQRRREALNLPAGTTDRECAARERRDRLGLQTDATDVECIRVEEVLVSATHTTNRFFLLVLSERTLSLVSSLA